MGFSLLVRFTYQGSKYICRNANDLQTTLQDLHLLNSMQNPEGSHRRSTSCSSGKSSNPAGRSEHHGSHKKGCFRSPDPMPHDSMDWMLFTPFLRFICQVTGYVHWLMVYCFFKQILRVFVHVPLLEDFSPFNSNVISLYIFYLILLTFFQLFFYFFSFPLPQRQFSFKCSFWPICITKHYYLTLWLLWTFCPWMYRDWMFHKSTPKLFDPLLLKRCTYPRYHAIHPLIL